MNRITYVLARATTDTGCAVQEILLQAVADASSKLWTSAAQHTLAVVASIRVIALSVSTHDGLALLVS